MPSIFISGDFCPIGGTQKLLMNNRIDLIYNEFINEIKKSDYAITNLECPLIDNGRKQDKDGPRLKANTKCVDILTYAGFDLVTLANNHIMDFNAEGLLSTIKVLDSNNINHVGAGYNLNQARKPFVINHEGLSIAILNIAENEFSNTHGKGSGANPLDLPSNYNDIRDTKSKYDKVIVIHHGGNENYNLPSPRLKKTLRFFVDAGADAVVNHHSHIYSGYEVYNEAPIFYSVGNFIFDYNQRDNSNWNTSYAVRLHIDDSIRYDIIPYYQFGEKEGLTLFTVEEHKEFLMKLEALNEIIKDDKLLEEHFSKFCLSLSTQFFHFLQPTKNRILHRLMKWGLLPSQAFGSRKNLHLNLVRCEAHRDVLLNILKNK